MLPGQVEDREVGRKGSRVTWLSAECLDLLQGTTIDMKDKLDVIIMASTDAVLWLCCVGVVTILFHKAKITVISIL